MGQRPQCMGCPRNRADSSSSLFLLASGAFTAADIAAPLSSVSKDTLIGDATVCIQVESAEEGYSDWCALVREGDQTVGWLATDDLVLEDDQSQVVPVRPFSAEDLVPASTPLVELLPLFGERGFFLLLTGNRITHVVTFQDFDKLPGKICLFALLAEMESRMTSYLTNGPMLRAAPFAPLSEGRLAKARQLYVQKYDASEETPDKLLLCTTLIDKITLIVKDAGMSEKLRSVLDDDPKRFLRSVEDVRNEIAHGDSILRSLSSPQALTELVAKVQRVLEVLEDSGAH